MARKRKEKAAPAEEPVKESPQPYTPRSDEVLEKLAWDTVEGRVFHSMYNRISDHEMTMVFMVIAFADQAYIDWMKASQIWL